MKSLSELYQEHVIERSLEDASKYPYLCEAGNLYFLKIEGKNFHFHQFCKTEKYMNEQVEFYKSLLDGLYK